MFPSERLLTAIRTRRRQGRRLRWWQGRLGLADDDWGFAFQSQGMSGGAWLGPTVEETILGLKEKGHASVFLQPIGFVCDHVEILYDIDIAFRKFAEEHGMRLWRAESLNDSPTFAAAVADVARKRLVRQ